MNNYTTDEILVLPMSVKERDHTSQSRQGRHVFISRYFYEFQQLPLQERLQLTGGSSNISDEDSFDSVDTIKNPKVWDIMQKAQSSWSALSVEIKNACCKRADALNRRPLPGQFQQLPEDILHPSVHDNMINGIYYDWKQYFSILKPCIVRKLRNGRAEVTYKFRKEEVKLGTQKFLWGYLSYNVRLARTLGAGMFLLVAGYFLQRRSPSGSQSIFGFILLR